MRLWIRDPTDVRVIGQWSAWRSPEAAKVAAAWLRLSGSPR